MRWLKWLLYALGGLITLLLLAYGVYWIKCKLDSRANLALAGTEAPRLEEDGFSFRDLNKNGRLDVYEDRRASTEDRVEDLLGQLSLEEKAGLMYLTMIPIGKAGALAETPTLSNPFSLLLQSASELILRRKMNHVSGMGGVESAAELAAWHNQIQKLAERTRLGIPVTQVSDPIHGVAGMPGASSSVRWLSTWPSQLGLAATRDSALVREFGDIARREYLAVGIRVALHPMADLATEPRWARVNGTFGEDADLSARLTEAYVLGFQGDTLGPHSVACQTKHFPGGGPQENGMDAHFASGKGQVYPGDRFDYHLAPFVEGALKARTAQLMPYYGIPRGQTSEEVAFAFNRDIIQGLLRDSLGFDGVVATDWGVIADMPVKSASAWGVEHLSERERTQKALEAGCDMFGGEYGVENIIALVEAGDVSEARIDLSVRRILRDKFTLGLFDDPYRDQDDLAVVRRPDFVEKGREAQRRSLVLLKNEGDILPLSADTKIYPVGLEEAGLAGQFPQIVGSPEEADVIVQKLATPSSPPSGGDLLERLIPQGRLDYPAEDLAEILERTRGKPTITIMTLTRPTVAPEINAASKAVIADFECEDDILLDLIFGAFSPSGRLPVEIPSSVAAVEAQLEDVPYDSKDPLYSFGFGLGY